MATGWLSNLMWRMRLIRNATFRNPPDWLVDAFAPGTGRATDSGVRVGTLSAFYYAPWWRGVNLLAGDIGQLPMILYRRTNEGKERADEHPASRFFDDECQVNEFMDACTFKELLQSHAVAYGNGRAGIVRDGRGQPEELVPFLPDRSYEEIDENGRLIHYTKLGDDQEHTPFLSDNVFHIKGLSFDGVSGYNTVHMARNSLGLGLGAEKHGNRVFRNSARPSVILESDGRFTRQDALQVLADWNEMLSGIDNQGKTALLSGGIKAKTLSQQNDHAQWMETRKFQVKEVANWLGIPPHKLGDDSRTSFNSLEEENRAYITSSLGRWIKKWEQQAYCKLLTEDQKRRRSHFFRFDADAFLRGDVSSRWAKYQIGRTIEVLSANEVRDMEDMNRIEGGDEYANPNTSSGSDQDPPGPPSPDDDGEEQVMQNRLQRLLVAESRRMVARAKSDPTVRDSDSTKFAKLVLREFGNGR